MRVRSALISACLCAGALAPLPARSDVVVEHFVAARAAIAAVTLVSGNDARYYLGAWNASSTEQTFVQIARIEDQTVFRFTLPTPTITPLAGGAKRISVSGSVASLGQVSFQATSTPNAALQACLGVYGLVAHPGGSTGSAPADVIAQIDGEPLTAAAEPCSGAWGTNVTGHYSFGFVSG